MLFSACIGAALVAILAGFGIIGHQVDTALAFITAAVFVLLASLCLVFSDLVPQKARPAVPRRYAAVQYRVPQGPGFFSQAFSAFGKFLTKALQGLGTGGAKAASWGGEAIKAHPMATVSVVAWVMVLVCLLKLGDTDEPFWWLSVLLIAFHAAVAFSLAAAGKLEEAYGKALKHMAILWAYASLWAMILTAAYGYEDGYLEWWTFPPFMLATFSLILAILAGTGGLKMAGKALGKALAGGFGKEVAFATWGFILVPLGVGLVLGTGHEFDFGLGAAIRDPLLLIVGSGMLLLGIATPLAYLLRFK